MRAGAPEYGYAPGTYSCDGPSGPPSTEAIVNTLILVMWSAAFGSFGWGMLRFFRTDAGLTWRTGLVALLGPAFAACHLHAIATIAPHRGSATAATVLYGAAIALFWSAIRACGAERPTAIGNPQVPMTLMTRGPYGYVRHPFYVSYAIFWTAGWIASGSTIALLSAIAMLTEYVLGARMEEAAFASSELADAYAAYRSRTGMFLPKLRATGR